MLKRILALMLVLIMTLSIVGCKKTDDELSSVVTMIENTVSDTEVVEETPSSQDSTSSVQSNPTASTQKPTSSSAPDKPKVDYSKNLPAFTNKDFEISAFWCPYDISEKGLKEYKDAGFNTLFTGNHSLSWTSENQFYLGSKRTMTALQNAKKVGLDVILNYNDWIAKAIEGDDYYGETPFSQHDVYGEYKDIIVGVHMVDEPGAKHIEEYGKQTLINDFKKVYPNAKYVVNLLPEYALDYQNWNSAEEMYDTYYNGIMKKFDKNRMISIDCYFFHKQFATKRRQGIMKNYDNVANFAKKNNASQTIIMQTAVSSETPNGFGEYEGNEFVTSLSEGDIRLQANMAIAFGADSLQYYCYSVPLISNKPMYKYCILNPDNTPSPLYGYVKNVNGECQALADALLSYKWQEATAMPGVANVAAVGEYYEMSEGKFENTKHFVNAQGTQNIVMSRFTSDKHGEGYMLVNFAERSQDNKINLQMKNCGALAIYGGVGFDGKPEIIELDNNGKCSIELEYGEGIFIVPLT